MTDFVIQRQTLSSEMTNFVLRNLLKHIEIILCVINNQGVIPNE